MDAAEAIFRHPNSMHKMNFFPNPLVNKFILLHYI